MANLPWFKQNVAAWLCDEDVMLLEPLAEFALMRLRLEMWRTTNCMLPDNDTLLMRLSRLDEYRSPESDPSLSERATRCLASAKQMLSKCQANGKQMLTDPDLLEQWNRLNALSEVRSDAGRVGGSRKKSGTKPLKAKAKQTISYSLSSSGSDLREEECEEKPAEAYKLPDDSGNERKPYPALPALWFSDVELLRLDKKFHARGLRREFYSDAFLTVDSWFRDTATNGPKRYPKSSNHARRVGGMGLSAALKNQRDTDNTNAASQRAKNGGFTPKPEAPHPSRYPPVGVTPAACPPGPVENLVDTLVKK